jgi:hypothetical protein
MLGNSSVVWVMPSWCLMAAYLLCILGGCRAQDAASGAWIGSASHGDKPGTGFAFTDGPGGHEGFVYVMDPNAPGEFAKSMRARMDHLEVTPKSVRFDVRFPGRAPDSIALEFPDGRAGSICTGHIDDDPEPIVFHRGAIPSAMGNYKAGSAKRGKETIWECIPEKPDDPWGLRFKSVGTDVTEATLYVFDPAHPRDFDRAQAYPATFEFGTPWVQELSFTIQRSEGTIAHLHYILSKESRNGGLAGYLSMQDHVRHHNIRIELVNVTRR